MASEYQQHSVAYYTTLGRATYQEVVGTPERIADEQFGQRYTQATAPGVTNLDSFLHGLRCLMRSIPQPRGLDYGCGAHYFVNQCAVELGWDVMGFDAVAENIQLARETYPLSAERYIHRDLLCEGIPVPNGSQDFVFCNAVFQHFSSDELDQALDDIHRVLKPGGVLLAIFKTKLSDWEAFRRDSGIAVRALDQERGKVTVDDPLVQEVFDTLGEEEQSRLREQLPVQERLFHLFEVNEVLGRAHSKGFEVIPSLHLSDNVESPGVIEYRSGRGMPSVAVYIRKAKLAD